MLELTLNLNEIDFEGGEDQQQQQPPSIVEEVIQQESMEGRNLESVPSFEQTDGQAITVVLATNQDGGGAVDTEKQRQLERTLSDSSYTEDLANDILKESVERLDPMVFVNKINEENVLFVSALNCTIRVSSFLNYLSFISLKSSLLLNALILTVLRI